MEPLPSALLEAFDPVEGQGVVCFVGSGPSIYAGLPSWPDLLLAVARAMNAENDIKPALEGGSYLEVAQYLVSLKSERAIKERIAEMLRQASKSPGDLHRLIVALPLAGIITTNYDLFLSDADIKRIFERPVTQQASGLVSHFRRRFIFHIHGHIDDPATIVVAKSNYDQFALGLSSEAIQFIRTVFHARAVLFIGFGFRDDNVDAILRDLQALGVTTGWNVFALMPMPDPKSPEKVIDAALRHRNVYPIYVEAAGDHGVFASMRWLEHLRDVVGRIVHARSNPVAKTPQAATLLNLARILHSEGYGELLQGMLRKVEGRPDLVDLSEMRKGRFDLSDLMDRVDCAEMRALLISINKIRRHPLIEDVLACLPPRP